MNKELEFFPKVDEELTNSSTGDSKTVHLKPLKIPQAPQITRKTAWCPIRSKVKARLWCDCNSDDAV